jgi:hypothetical protein
MNEVSDYFKVGVEHVDPQKNQLELPKNVKITIKKTIVVDSRQRDYSIYPNPNNYYIDLFQTYRNVERLELIAVMIPKTEYNINNNNNKLNVIINGVSKVVSMTIGQYIIGSSTYGNVDFTADGNDPLFGLLAELKRVLDSTGHTFKVFLCTAPSYSGGTGKNASILNRICITCDTPFQINFASKCSPFRILGFPCKLVSSGNNVIYGSSISGECTASDLTNENTISVPNSILATFDYNLYEDPQYIIMDLTINNNTMERIESKDISTNNKFCTVIYDANEPDNIVSYNSASGMGTQDVVFKALRNPGRLKALKGTDFDKKIIDFNPPITVENFQVSFYKYYNELYDFHNREHSLIFEIDVIEFDPRYNV